MLALTEYVLEIIGIQSLLIALCLRGRHRSLGVLADWAVVGEDARHPGGDVEVVVGGDGEVPHVACSGDDGRAGDGRSRAVAGAKPVASSEVVGVGPGVSGVVPERVVRGGVDHGRLPRRSDSEVEEVGVVVDPHLLHRLGFRLLVSV